VRKKGSKKVGRGQKVTKKLKTEKSKARKRQKKVKKGREQVKRGNRRGKGENACKTDVISRVGILERKKIRAQKLLKMKSAQSTKSKTIKPR
jgi:hypothetical protein